MAGRAESRQVVTRAISGATTGVRQRWRLLRLLVLGGWPWSVAVAGLLLVAALAPTLQVVAAGAFVAALTDALTDALADAGSGRVIAATSLLAGTVLVGEAAFSLHGVCAAILGRRIDGRIRRTVRDLAMAPPQIDHLESAEFQDDAARASDDGQDFGRVRSPGTAAVGQLLVLSRYLTAIVAGVLLASYSVVLALVLLLVALVARVRVSRQWANLASTKDATMAGQRRIGYWTGLAGAGAVKEVRLFGLAPWVVARRTSAAFRANASHWRGVVRVLRQQWLPGVMLGTAAVAALAVPGLDALRGAMTGAELVRYVLAGFVILGLSQLGPEAHDIDYGVGAVDAVDRLARRHGGATGGATVAQRAPLVFERLPTVRFEEVGFAYPGMAHRPVLAGLTLTLRPGETLAVVGRNGAGKTTMVKLLAGLYRPTAGRITVDGKDLAELDMEAWRRHVTVLFQDFVRYPATVADNVALSAPDAYHGPDADGPDAVVEALRRAGADNLVEELPFGVETSLWREGTTGVDLSGGQWQRVAIARALFAVAHGRRLLVLDEPTAHLDVRSEALFYERVVSAVRPEATTLLISHRMSTVRPASRIVMLRDGGITEAGSHDELMALGGEYHRLFTLQATRFADNKRTSDDGGRP